MLPSTTLPPLAVNASSWRMHKLGQPISPLEVALNGSQAQHAVGDEGLTVDSADGRHRLRIMCAGRAGAGIGWCRLLSAVRTRAWAAVELAGAGAAARRPSHRPWHPACTAGAPRSSLDAAVVSPGQPTPFPSLRDPPDLRHGMAHCLCNNVWGAFCRALAAPARTSPDGAAAGGVLGRTAVGSRALAPPSSRALAPPSLSPRHQLRDVVPLPARRLQHAFPLPAAT